MNVTYSLDHAVRSRRIPTNPAHGLGLPKIQRRDYVFLTHEQLRDLAADAGPWRVFVLLLGYTGLRWGEATALRVCDIDLARRRIDVRRAFSDVGGRVVVGSPESHQSRTVPIPRFLACEIDSLITGKTADDLVFTMPGGSVLRLSNWRGAVFTPARHIRDGLPVYREADRRGGDQRDGVDHHLGLRSRVCVISDTQGVRALMDQRSQLSVRRDVGVDHDPLGLRVTPPARRSLDALTRHRVPE